MKKLMALILSAAFFALAITAQASVSKVELAAQADEKAGQTYTLRVYDIGASIDGGDIVYFDETVSDTQANVLFSFDFGMKSGAYPYVIKSETGEWQKEGVIAFTNEAEFENAMEALAKALQETNPGAAVKQVFNDYGGVFNLDYEFDINTDIVKLDTTKAYDMIAANISAESSIAELQSVYRQSMLLCALEMGDTSLIKRIDEGYVEQLGVNDEIIISKYDSLSDTDRLSVASMEKGAYASAEDYVKAHSAAVAIAVLNVSRSWQALGEVISEMNDIAELGFPSVSDSVKSTVLQKLVNKRPFLSKSDFSAKAAASVSEAGNVSAGSVVKNTGGGSGTTYNTGSAGTVYPVSGNNSQQVTKSVFEDLSTAEWAREAIEYLAETGAISGRSETEFAPGEQITREEFVKILISAMNISADGDSYFDDVPDTAWYKLYVTAAVSSGVAVGIGDNMFGVGRNITRQDAAVMIVRALSIKGVNLDEAASAFNDNSEIAEYAVSAVGKLQTAGVVSGNPDGSFAPRNSVTRAETAVMIYSAINLL